MQQSFANTDQVLLGQWSHVRLEVDPLNINAMFSSHYMGAVRDAAFEMTREDQEIRGTTFPSAVAFVVSTTVGISFTGNFAEAGAVQLNSILGNLPTAAMDGGYIYFGASCQTEANYLSLIGQRTRCQSEGGGIFACRIYKTRGTGNTSLGSGDADVTVAGTFTGVEDNTGAFGGSPESRLGYIYSPPIV